MRFQLGTLKAAILLGGLFYAITAVLILRHIFKTIVVWGTTIGRPRTPTPWTLVDYCLFGLLLLPVLLIVFVIIAAIVQHRNKRRPGHCPGCGSYYLRHQDTRCWCGTRLPRRGSTEPLFPVTAPFAATVETPSSSHPTSA